MMFDAGTVTTTSDRDGIHLDADQHVVLGNAIADIVQVAFQRLRSDESSLVGAEDIGRDADQRIDIGTFASTRHFNL